MLKNKLALFVEYASRWVHHNVIDNEERVRLLSEIDKVTPIVYSNIDRENLTLINDFIRFVYVISLQNSYNSVVDWLKVGDELGVSVCFPMNPSREPTKPVMVVGSLSKNKRNESVQTEVAFPSEYENVLKDLKAVLFHLSTLSSHYRDLVVGGNQKVNKLDYQDDAIEDHFIEHIIKAGYSETFMPILLICRRQVFEDTMKTFEYFAILGSIELFIQRALIEMGRSDDYLRDWFYSFANMWSDGLDGNFSLIVLWQMCEEMNVLGK